MKKAATIGLVLAIIIVAAAYFANNKPDLTGNSVIETHVLITGDEYPFYCNISMPEGFNLISVPCIYNTTIPIMLASINGSYTSVHYYNASSPDKWKAYNPQIPSWAVQDLSNINLENGYWINTTRSTALTANGSIFTINIIHLKKGWNLAGYPINKTKNVSDAISSVSNGQILQIYAFNSTTNQFDMYDSRNNTNTLGFLTHGRGYWINASEDLLWGVSE